MVAIGVFGCLVLSFIFCFFFCVFFLQHFILFLLCFFSYIMIQQKDTKIILVFSIYCKRVAKVFLFFFCFVIVVCFSWLADFWACVLFISFLI